MNSEPKPQDQGAAALGELRRLLDGASSRDAGRLRARLGKLERKPSADAVRALARDIAASVARRQARAALVPPITLDESLPIAQRADEITALLARHQVLVIAGETGSGKTTQLPKLCLAAGRGTAGMIGCTQPRRLAARAMARRVASELGGEGNDQPGGVVGFEVRFAKQLGDNTLVKFMTDGILLAEMAHDRWLSGYDTLIVDEAHERSLNIDFLLGYLKQLLQRRCDLKLIVTSATIDTARFAEHFGGAPVVTVEGRAYPVEVRYQPPEREVSLTDRIATALDDITREDPRGDVLVFLPGEREIRDAHLALDRRKYRHTEVLPLYARLSVKEQDRVFKPGAARRIVLATNVAETSLTVPRIRWVVDSGDARVKRYSRRSRIERLHIEPVSQAAASQRAGRCGRVGPGVCVRLYDEADFASRVPYTDPEILRSALADVILRMLDLGLGEVEAFPFLDPPDPRAVNDGWRTLAELGAVEAGAVDQSRRLTPLGKQLARIPIDAQLARMLVEGQQHGVLREVLPIVAFLGVQDPRERPPDKQQQADAAHREFADPQSDFVGVLNLWTAYQAAHEELAQSKLRDWCARHFVSFMRMREWGALHRQLLLEMGTGDGQRGRAFRTLPAGGTASRPARSDDSINAPTPPTPHPQLYQPIHLALLAGLPTNVARKDEQGMYRGTRERRFKVFPGSALAKKPPQWLLAAQVLDLGGKVWGMQCARVEPEWIECQAAHLLRRTCSDPHWSRERGAVQAYEQVSLYGLVLTERRTVTFAKQDPALAHVLFLREALARCEIDCRADFVHANARVLDQARELEAQQRREGLLKPDDDLAAFFDGKLPEAISSSRALDAWYRRASASERAALRWSSADVLEAGAGYGSGAFPDALEVGNQKLALEYRFVPGDDADGVTLRVPLALLNAIPAARCEWLVPGLIADKVAVLIRGLPKALRRNFVPAPDFARAFVEAEAARDESLARALAAFLQRVTGVGIARSAFDDVEIPAHLNMRFDVRDEHDKSLARGRDLDALREGYAARAREAFSREAGDVVSREHVRDWEFDVVARVTVLRDGTPAYPALVDLGAAVALQVFENADEAATAHHGGVERLLRLSLDGDFKRARKQLPLKPKLVVAFAPHGRADSLREDIVAGAFADLLADHDLGVRDRTAWAGLRDLVSRGLFGAAMERLQLAEPMLAALAELQPWMQPAIKRQAPASYADLRGQLDALLAPGFLRQLPHSRLVHLPRYLTAIRLRAEKLRSDPARDHARMQQVLPYWRKVLEVRAAGGDSESLNKLRWLTEEWRVSVFAQELKTAEPVSGKRMAQALAALDAS